MPEVLDFVNGRPVRRGTDSSADLQPSIPEEQAKPKPKAKYKPKPKPKPPPKKNFLQQLQNDLSYEFNQARRDPVKAVMRAVGNAAPVAAGMALGMRSPVGTARPGMVAGAGVADNALRMGYSAFQRLTGAKQADPSRGMFGQALDLSADMVYRMAGETPPSEQNRAQRDADMMRRSAALNLGLATIPLLGPARALAATTKLGKAVKGGLAFGANEAASQFLDDNTGGGFMDLPNSVLPKNMQLPGGLGSRAGQLDMVDSALATFGGNVAGGMAVGAGVGAAGVAVGTVARAAVGLADKVFPATMRRLRNGRLKAEEVEARGRLAQAGVQEDNGDGAYRPGPAVAEAAPQRPSTFAEADAAMRQRLGENAPPDPDAAARAELQQVDERLAQLEQQLGAGRRSEPLEEVLGFGPDPRVVGRPDVYSDVQKWLAQREGEVNPRDQTAYEQWLQSNQQIRGIPSQQMEPGGPVLDPGRPLGEFDPDLDPWADYDPELPEATDVLKTLDQLDPAVIRQMDEAEGSITEMVQQAQQAQAGFQLNPNLRLDRVAAPTDRVSRLYLEGAGEAEGWDQVIEALNPTDLRSLAHPSNSPELAARIESLTGKAWDEFTAGDIRVGMRALSKEGRTVLAERLTGKEFMPTEEIAVDPQRFQFKQGTDGEGQQTGASLSEEEFWNPRAEDVIEVWDDPADGKTYVVNGHNRLALAKRLGIPSLPVRRITATKPSAARAFGAIANISQGQGNAFDAAKFIREAGITTPEQLKQAGMTGERSWARDGLALSKLPEDLYRAAVDGDISLRKSVIIGESGLPEPGMRALAAEVRRNPSIPDWELKEIGAMTANSPAVQPRQGGIPGMEDYGLDEGARQKVRLVRLVEEALRKDAKVFGGVARAAGQLEGKAANTIDRTGSKAVAEESNTALAAFGRMKYQSGEVSDRLNRAVQQIADGEQPGAVARQVADEMPTILQREMDAAMGRPATPEVDPDQVDLFAPAEATPMRPRRGTPLADGLAADLNELGGILGRQARATDEFINKQAGRIQERMTAAELEAAKMRLVARALNEGEARPNTTPIPDLSEAPRVDPSEALADIQARGGIEADSPAMRALEDELRLVEEQALQDAAARQDAIEAMKDAYGYDELTFEEKKALGMTEGWEERLDPDTQALLDEVDQAADALRQSTADGARLAQRMRETEMGIYDVVDPAERGADRVLPTGGLRRPVRPVPLQLTQAAQPEFTLPESLGKAAPRYGQFTVAFDSDLDRAAYILQNDLKKPSKSAAAFREAVQAAGLNPAAVAAHGARVKAALKELAKGKGKGELRVPRQPWDTAGDTDASIANDIDYLVRSPAEITKVERQLTALINQVAGPEVAIRFEKTYKTIIRPKEWGGDGVSTGISPGYYNFTQDLIVIRGVQEGDLIDLSETALHESFHRIQRMALSEKDVNVLDGAMARLKVEMGAGIDGISYSESQAVTFQRYARARLLGEDPTAAVIRADLLGAGRDPTRLEKAALPVIRAFEAIYDFVERIYNLVQGNGFASVKSIFERARSGALAETDWEGFNMGPEGYNKFQTWKKYSAVHEKVGRDISAIDAQIAEIQQRAAREGC